MRHAGFALAALALLLSGCQATLLRGVGVISGAPRADQRGEPFLAEHSLQLDRYEPRDPPRACVVFFYGGSWRSGQRDWYRFVGRALADRGYRALIPDYRKAPQHRFPTFIEDAAAAVAHARSQHCQGADARPLPLFLVGHSAGAHIAALLATDARYLAGVGLRPDQLAGVIGLAGPYDFLPMTAPDVIDVFRGDPNLFDSQPIHFVDGDEPAMLLLHGGKDRVVYPKNSLNLAAALRAHGGSAETIVYPEAGHVGLLLALRSGSRHPLGADLGRFIDQRVRTRTD